ncbi:ATP-dependent DNA ligase [Roseovarius salinarum]|uniref:ATP-dependent DNA ligase n=1 Tax=Roseovarius salinarum TaxID=1981892 RepID=UPI000C31DD1D|nr:ATP-dependent DNA ligase [Roseovarius salinarum]
MRQLARLFTAVDQTTRTNAKVEALAEYFRAAPPEDRVWTVALFSGRRPRRAITTSRLREWAAERAGIPLWLFEESYPIVGDLAETIALVLPAPTRSHDDGLSTWIGRLRALDDADEAARKAAVLDAWDRMPPVERLVFNKLITGGFRVGVSRKLMTRALAQATGREEAELAHRLMGDWTPDSTTWHTLIEADDPVADTARPYPFCLAHGLDETGPEALGAPHDWRAEWKWDGIRGQLIARAGAHHLWSRGEELMTDRFPEFAGAADWLPDGTVIDGEVLAWSGDGPLPFAALQKRIGRKHVPRSLLAEAPAVLLAYDLLELGGRDIRARPLAERRAALDEVLARVPENAALRPSPLVPFDSWADLAALRGTARARRAEGLMLKRADSPYHAGRRKGDWWKWKLDPLTIDAVLIYAQQGHGRRANLFTDFTFAVRAGDDLVPFTKAYSGLTDAEFREITQWVRRNTVQRFGPVRQVRPAHVFEIAFEGIQESRRHKSGVALRFPRMSRWRHDKGAAEADTLEHLHEMLAAYG